MKQSAVFLYFAASLAGGIFPPLWLKLQLRNMVFSMCLGMGPSGAWENRYAFVLIRLCDLLPLVLVWIPTESGKITSSGLNFWIAACSFHVGTGDRTKTSTQSKERTAATKCCRSFFYSQCSLEQKTAKRFMDCKDCWKLKVEAGNVRSPRNNILMCVFCNKLFIGKSKWGSHWVYNERNVFLPHLYYYI